MSIQAIERSVSNGLVIPRSGNFKRRNSGLYIPEKPKLAMDIHEVLLDHTGRESHRGMRAYYKSQYGFELDPDSLHTLNYGLVLGHPYERYRSDIRGYQRSGLYAGMMPNPGAVEAVLELQSSVDITAVTATPNFLKDVNENRLDEVFGLPFFAGGVVYSANGHDKATGESKGAICEALGIQFLVDDFPDYITEAADRGIIVYIYNQRWNRDLQHPNTRRFYHMSQLPGLVRADIIRMSLQEQLNNL